jgi:tetratricopeptide (TPR) repeat protein
MPEPTKKSFVIVICITLALSTLLVFWQVRNFDFINYDDDSYLYENPHVLTGLTWGNIVWAFTTAHVGNWLPLTWASFMLDCRLFGPDPGWIHLENAFLHLVNTLLLFAVLKRMTNSLWPSAFVAAAFALHPMHVESVAWITERKDVLSTFFFLLTLAAYVAYVRRRGLFRYLLTVLLFAFGLLAKPMLVTLPFVLLLGDYWPLNRFLSSTVTTSARKSAPRRHTALYHLLIEKIPFFALAVVSSIITFLVQRAGGAVADVNAFPFEARIANAFLAYAAYMGKMFWPQNLAIFYPPDTGGIRLWQAALCVLLFVAISFFAIYFGRNRKYLPVGWFWFVVTLIPVIGLIQSGAQALADRYTYIPYIGLFIMIAWGLPELLSKWPHRKIALGLSAAVVLAALAFCSYIQLSYWKNSTTVFSHAIEVTQNNYIAHFNLGRDLRSQGKTALAFEHLKKAFQIAPYYAQAANGFGSALYDQGDIGGAIEYFQKALHLKPDYALAHNNLGLALQKEGKLNEAVAEFAQAVQINPDFVTARNNLANALVMQGRLDEAVDQFRAILRLNPNWLAPMNNLALLIATHPEIKNGDVNEAISLARRACELTNYKSPAFIATLAAAYAAAGKFPEAMDTAQKAMSLAEITNQPQLKNIIQYQLTLYSQGKPYIEPPSKPLSDANKP